MLRITLSLALALAALFTASCTDPLATPPGARPPAASPTTASTSSPAATAGTPAAGTPVAGTPAAGSVATPAAGPSVNPSAPGASAISDAFLTRGTSTGEVTYDGTPGERTDAYGPKDDFHLVVQGDLPPDMALSVRWYRRPTEMLRESKATKAARVYEFSVPATEFGWGSPRAWVPEDYRVDILVNGEVVRSIPFKVRK